MAGIMDGDSSGRVYRAVHGHMTARYWYRHATWNVACSLSGKVTVTASPCTGWAHHTQGRTGFPCLLRGRLAFAMLLSFMRSPGNAFRLVREHEHTPLGQPALRMA